MTIKVTNTETNRTFIHRNISPRDLSWIKTCPNLFIEILRGKQVYIGLQLNQVRAAAS